MKLITLALLGASACGVDRTIERPTEPTIQPAATAKERDARFIDAIQAAAPAYLQWGRVDERPRAAPTDCAMPSGDPQGQASRVRISEAADSPHDKKLYFLWANHRDIYLGQSHLDQPFATGFMIVKESFQADGSGAPAAPARGPEDVYARMPPPLRTLRVGGETLHTGAAAGLYVMTKVGDKQADGTDLGWIYGTIAPDGHVTSAGRVASCMGCHESATHERLFGLK